MALGFQSSWAVEQKIDAATYFSRLKRDFLDEAKAYYLELNQCQEKLDPESIVAKNIKEAFDSLYNAKYRSVFRNLF